MSKYGSYDVVMYFGDAMGDFEKDFFIIILFSKSNVWQMVKFFSIYYFYI